MSKDSSKDDKDKYFDKKSVDLPDFTQYQNTAENSAEEETNVLRVPFGVRFSKKKRPQKNQNIATLILPITSYNSPTPPPYVA